MAITKEKKAELVQRFGGSPQNTGLPEVEIAILTAHISRLTDHLKENPKDKHCRHGLLKLVGKRRSLLKYLTKVDIDRYRKIIAELGIRK